MGESLKEESPSDRGGQSSGGREIANGEFVWNVLFSQREGRCRKKLRRESRANPPRKPDRAPRSKETLEERRGKNEKKNTFTNRQIPRGIGGVSKPEPTEEASRAKKRRNP